MSSGFAAVPPQTKARQLQPEEAKGEGSSARVQTLQVSRLEEDQRHVQTALAPGGAACEKRA